MLNASSSTWPHTSFTTKPFDPTHRNTAFVWDPHQCVEFYWIKVVACKEGIMLIWSILNVWIWFGSSMQLQQHPQKTHHAPMFPLHVQYAPWSHLQFGHTALMLTFTTVIAFPVINSLSSTTSCNQKQKEFRSSVKIGIRFRKNETYGEKRLYCWWYPMLITIVPQSKSLSWLKEKNNLIKWLCRSNITQSDTHRQEEDSDEDPAIEEGDVTERESHWSDDE